MDDILSPRINKDEYLHLQILNSAAGKIQRAWRRYIDVQVFKYYKNLVIFHNEGDPAFIMRYINPAEAQLIDAASGIHIRFRLAGQQFPPTIFYKIYTHRPIQDIGANAPRDYTKPYIKIKSAELRNNRTSKIVPCDDELGLDGWYRRVENNGWRPVSSKHLLQMNIDYYYGNKTNKHMLSFHHLKIKRNEDVELNKKKKKLEWMKKMYHHGSAASKNATTNSDKFKQSANLDAPNSIADDWEVDELLEWSNALDFDTYYDNWQRIGTTKRSENLFLKLN